MKSATTPTGHNAPKLDEGIVALARLLARQLAAEQLATDRSAVAPLHHQAVSEGGDGED